MPEHNLFQSQELRQEQILAPHQIQSLEILLAPMLQLQEKISQELAENPVLEQEKTPGEDLAGDILSSASSDDNTNEKPEKPSEEEEIEMLVKFADTWRDTLPAQNRKTSPEEDEKRQHFFDSLTDTPSLQEQLLEQLRFSDCDTKTAEAAEVIIGSIDNNGYLRSHLADIAITADTDMDVVNKALKLVQSFDPPGIGATDLKECLLLQLERKNVNEKINKNLIHLVKNHLEEIASNKIPKIASKMKMTSKDVYGLINELKELSPYPGSAISPENPVYVIPETTVEKSPEGEFILDSSDDNLPSLKISNLYMKLLENPDTPAETKEYIKNKLLSGKMLIKSIEQRQSTIKKISQVIIDSQHDFFKKGIEHLRPMTMQQVADKLGVHETTISRAISNKYIKTPNGLFEFKFFFSSGFQSSGGEELSSKSVKEKIRDLIVKENPSKPLSDSKISKILKESGIPVARRTVAKYREKIGIQSSHLRKKF
jgi:RNA polymerase sigma-54 factor